MGWSLCSGQPRETVESGSKKIVAQPGVRMEAPPYHPVTTPQHSQDIGNRTLSSVRMVRMLRDRGSIYRTFWGDFRPSEIDSEDLLCRLPLCLFTVDLRKLARHVRSIANADF